ncbi:Terpene synthase [Melia azedarach]|uniref:Terpene synthase n=1 Tax=Melia azedarach TaxID=155640 RepID=A0ACC1YLI1_MELAZ|nr:Terpene synthase [Melia azedarach]
MSSKVHENRRPLANFRPTIWKDTFDFMSSPKLEPEDDRLFEELKEQVKEMLSTASSVDNPIGEVILINSLCRLGVFNKYKKSDGKFKESLISDVRGILSLYEAAQLRVHEENILEEALTFTTTHLKKISLAPNTSPQLAKHVTEALEQPFHTGVPRLEELKYISFYEHEESRNDTLLKFAKLDFNRVQLLHKQELSDLTRYLYS